MPSVSRIVVMGHDARLFKQVGNVVSGVRRLYLDIYDEYWHEDSLNTFSEVKFSILFSNKYFYVISNNNKITSLTTLCI